jgi:hypothetical protein
MNQGFIVKNYSKGKHIDNIEEVKAYWWWAVRGLSAGLSNRACSIIKVQHGPDFSGFYVIKDKVLCEDNIMFNGMDHNWRSDKIRFLALMIRDRINEVPHPLGPMPV